MNAQTRDLVFRLATTTVQGPKISPEEFLASTRIDQPREWSLEELAEAIHHENAADAEAAMIVTGTFGFDRRWIPLYESLLESDWHQLHENAAEILGDFAEPSSIPSLIHAAHHVPDYLDYDEGRSLANKAIHAIAKIPGPEAEAALLALTSTLDDRPLRAEVETVLARRHVDFGGPP